MNLLIPPIQSSSSLLLRYFLSVFFLIRHCTHMWRVSPSGLTRRRFTHANVRRDIHSFLSLRPSISLRVEITTCPNCCRKSVQLVKRYVSQLHVCFLTRLYYTCVREKFTHANKNGGYSKSSSLFHYVRFYYVQCYNSRQLSIRNNL